MESATLTRYEDIILDYLKNQFLVAQPKLAETITKESSLVRSGILDSFGIYMVVMYVEQEFGISVDDDEAVPDYFDSVSAIARFVNGKQNRPAADAVGSV